MLAYGAAIVGFRFDIDRAFAHAHHVYHHKFTHGIGFVLAAALLAAVYVAIRGPGQVDRIGPERRSWGRVRAAACTSALVAAVTVVHIFSDLVGSGSAWPIRPYWPFSEVEWGLSWSWDLGHWVNHALLWGLLAGGLLYARYAGRSFFECVHYGLDRWVVRILQAGSDRPSGNA